MVSCEPEDNPFIQESGMQEGGAVVWRVCALERYAVLATVSNDQPYTSLMAFAATRDLRSLVLVTRRDSHKHENLAENAKAALLIENCTNDPSDTQDAVAITAIGEIEEAIGEERQQLLELFLTKHPYLADFAAGFGVAVLQMLVSRYQIVSQFETVKYWIPTVHGEDLAVTTELPEGAINVVHAGEHSWRFDFPRLTEAAYDQLHSAIALYWEGRDAEAEASLRNLIRRYPEFIDALHHLALLLNYTGRTEEAYKIWQDATLMGLECLPESVITDKDEIPWLFLENRPFLRAYHALGLELRARDVKRLAAKIWERMLSMNPNDNQGIRALAIEAYLSLGEDQKALTVTEHYLDDVMPDTLYGRVLALYRLGQEVAAEEALAVAMHRLPRVAHEIAKKRHRKPRDLREDRVVIGSAEEAYLYWQDAGHLWKQTPGAPDFVRDYLEAHSKIAKG